MSAEGYTQRIRPEKTGPHNPLVLFDHSATLRLLRLGATQQASLRETQKDMLTEVVSWNRDTLVVAPCVVHAHGMADPGLRGPRKKDAVPGTSAICVVGVGHGIFLFGLLLLYRASVSVHCL